MIPVPVPGTGNGIRERRRGKGSFLFLCMLCASVFFTSAVHADAPTFTLAMRGAGLRTEPRLTSALGEWVVDGESYAVVARTNDKSWLKLVVPKTNATGWILASLGTVQGDVTSLKVEVPKTYKPSNTKLKLSPFISPITPETKKLWQASVKAGRRADQFTVVGDCNSEPSAYLWRLSAGSFDVSKYPELQRAVEQFAWSFTRGSSAAFSGFNSASMFDGQWASPQLCDKSEGPLTCELRRSNASIAFVSLGTGDQFTWKDFPANYQRIIDYLLENKVLPVLVTKADDLESQQGGAAPNFINDAVRKLGAEYGVPVIDFYAATRNLPDHGLRNEGNENFHMRPEGSDLRVLLTLQTLTAITSK